MDWPTQYSRVMLQAGTNCISFNVFESGDYRLARRVQTRPGGIHILEKAICAPETKNASFNAMTDFGGVHPSSH